MGNHEHESWDNDFRPEDVEISELPPMEEGRSTHISAISNVLAKFGARIPQQRRTWRILIGIATVSLLLGLLLSNVSVLKTDLLGLFPAPTPTATDLQDDPFFMVNATPKPGLDNPIGNFTPIPLRKGALVRSIADPAPQNCALVPAVTSAREIGQSPVWLTGFDGPRATIHLYGFSEPIAHNIYGWPILIQLMVAKNFTQPVTLTGSNLGSGPTIFFAFYPGERPMDSLILGTQQSIINPIQPEPGQKAAWIATMFLFGAGCYYLTASWPGGSWTIHFAAGR